jgi:hypothetical protein
MSLREVAIDAVVFVVAITVAGSFGYVHGYKRATNESDAKVLQANAKTHEAQVQAQASETALTNVKRLLDQQKASAAAARKIADQALLERDATNAKLATAVRQRQEAERKAAHESPDCAELVRMPLCPAVAQRLFQPSGQTHTAPAVSH